MLRRLPRLSSFALIAALAIAAPANAQIVLGGDSPTTQPGTSGITLGGAPASPVTVTAGADLRINPDADAKAAFAIPDFASDDAALARQVTDVIRADLISSGLFTAVAPASHASLAADINTKPAFADWTTAGAQVLTLGKITSADGRLTIQFRVYDVAANKQVSGTQYILPATAWRRGAHKVADEIYAKLTGAAGYFDTRIAFVSDGPGGKSALNLIDRDGANAQQPANNIDTMRGGAFSPDGSRIAYSAMAPIPGKASQAQRTTILYDLDTGRRDPLTTLSPQPNADARFSADGRSVIYSRKVGTNNEIGIMDLPTRKETVLNTSPASDTSPALSPDGSKYVFVSDRGGSPQLYVARVDGGDVQCASGAAKACRITSGSDARPTWAPTGDMIAFERKQGANTVIGVVKSDGTGEKLLTSGAKDTAPSWSSNGHALVFARDDGKHSKLQIINRSGSGQHELATPGDAYEPTWSPLLK